MFNFIKIEKENKDTIIVRLDNIVEIEKYVGTHDTKYFIIVKNKNYPIFINEKEYNYLKDKLINTPYTTIENLTNTEKL